MHQNDRGGDGCGDFRKRYEYDLMHQQKLKGCLICEIQESS